MERAGGALGTSVSQPRLHPRTPATLALCAIVIVFAVDRPIVSLAALLLAAACALPSRRARRGLSVAAIAGASAAGGFFLMYAPFGREPWWGPLTSDGMAVACGLSLRFAAAAAIGVVAAAYTDSDRLMRDLQPRLPAPLVYVVGSTLRLYPMAARRFEGLRQVAITRGVQGRWNLSVGLLVPLLVGLVDDAATRARPLEQTGIARPGVRTVLRPVPNPPLQRCLRWLMLALTLAVVGASAFGVGVCGGAHG